MPLYRDSTLDRPRRRAKLRLIRRLSDDARCCRRRSRPPAALLVVLTLNALSELRRVAEVAVVDGRNDTGLRGGVDNAASAR
jgi:hypothetical protein